jgi:hypothetical protein
MVSGDLNETTTFTEKVIPENANPAKQVRI